MCQNYNVYNLPYVALFDSVIITRQNIYYADFTENGFSYQNILIVAHYNNTYETRYPREFIILCRVQNLTEYLTNSEYRLNRTKNNNNIHMKYIL